MYLLFCVNFFVVHHAVSLTASLSPRCVSLSLRGGRRFRVATTGGAATPPDLRTCGATPFAATTSAHLFFLLFPGNDCSRATRSARVRCRLHTPTLTPFASPSPRNTPANSQKIPAKIRLRNKKHSENVTKRGNVTLSSGKENTGSTVGPVLLGLFLFVVVGNGT
jgi:hypothetical protein